MMSRNAQRSPAPADDADGAAQRRRSGRPRPSALVPYSGAIAEENRTDRRPRETYLHLVPGNVGLHTSKDEPILRGVSQTHSPPAVLMKARENMPAR
jgi:hypothetical protein